MKDDMGVLSCFLMFSFIL